MSDGKQIRIGSRDSNYHQKKQETRRFIQGCTEEVREVVSRNKTLLYYFKNKAVHIAIRTRTHRKRNRRTNVTNKNT